MLNLFDSTSNRVVGGLPPPVPSTSHSSSQRNEHDCQKVGPRVSNSQSTMAMSSLVPSASTEPISEWQGGSNRSRHNRSISEPDFGKSPMKVNTTIVLCFQRMESSCFLTTFRCFSLAYYSCNFYYCCFCLYYNLFCLMSHKIINASHSGSREGG